MEAYDNIPLPEDWKQPAEWVYARLMYPQNPEARFGGGRFRRFGQVLDWRSGGTSWTQDYPRADRHFAQALRRLSRVEARSVEQPVNPDETDDFYNWPWMNAGEMGDWKLTEAQAKVIREYLLRGGFLMLDDFWGPGRIRALRAEHEDDLPRPAGGGDRQRQRYFSFRLQSRRPVSSAGAVGAEAAAAALAE